MSLLGKRKKWQSHVERHLFCLTFLAHENRAPGDPTIVAHCTKEEEGWGKWQRRGWQNYVIMRRSGFHLTGTDFILWPWEPTEGSPTFVLTLGWNNHIHIWKVLGSSLKDGRLEVYNPVRKLLQHCLRIQKMPPRDPPCCEEWGWQRHWASCISNRMGSKASSPRYRRNSP